MKTSIIKYEPEILMSLGIAGMMFSTVWGVRATVKATELVKAKESSDVNSIQKLSNKEIVKLVWKLYIPSAASLVVSIPCIIAGNRVANKRYTALATAYTITETAMQEYADNTIKLVGERKEKDIREAVAKNQVANTAPQGPASIILTGDGDSLFLESISGRYFKSSWNKIQKAANALNERAIKDGGEGWIYLNDWFDELGLEATAMGDQIGWDLSKGAKSLIDIETSSHMTPDKVPVGAISYRNYPKLLE